MVSVPVEILLVEDNPGDIRLIMEYFKGTDISYNIVVAKDGQTALQILKQEDEYADMKRPNLIILDLNLPRINGIEVLKEVKKDDDLKIIPIIILTTSRKEEDIMETYQNNVNAYLTKPVDLDQYSQVISSIQDFWLSKVKLP